MQTSQLTVPLEIKSIDDDKDFFQFEGHASTFGNVDLGDDVIERGAFTESLKKRMPKLLWQHDMREPLGIFIEAFEDAKGLFVRGKMPKDDKFVSERVIPQMKIGSITSMSIGFSVNDFELKDGIRILKALNLFEASLVTFPMNEQATVTGMKAATPFKDLPLAARDRPWDSGAANARVREFTKSTDEPSNTYLNGFLWYDRADRENFGAYKLPFVDVIDGKLTAVPRGIFAAAAAMQGARGGVDIPTADRPGVERHITRYYDKMDLETPFGKSGLSMVELEGFSRTEFEQLLRGSGIFSRKACKAIASKFIAQCDAGDLGQCDAENEAILKELGKITKSLK